ncbi:MAG: hypothetical protein JRJ60_05515 [Deltaproteobacteria bacterium]|nr:hypothetical protein [Deltaproteobacteria bacterium]
MITPDFVDGATGGRKDRLRLRSRLRKRKVKAEVKVEQQIESFFLFFSTLT